MEMNTVSKNVTSKGNQKNQNSDSISVAQSTIQFIKADSLDLPDTINIKGQIVEERGEMATISPTGRRSAS